MRLALAVFLLAGSLAPAEEAAAPDASFTDAGGRTVKLSDYRGKQAVVLLFQRGFAGDFACFYCGRQTRAYKAAYDAFRAAGTEVIVVLPGAKDPAGYLKAVGEADEEKPDSAFAVPFPVVTDADFAACGAFGVKHDPKARGLPVSEPATVVISKEGAILWAYHGKNPEDRPEPEAVLKVLRGEKAGAPPEPAAPPAGPTLAWRPYDDGLAEARKQKKPVLLEFYAGW